jgi:hypothetical protein
VHTANITVAHGFEVSVVELNRIVELGGDG